MELCLLASSPSSAVTLLGVLCCVGVGYLMREGVSILRQYPGRVARERRAYLEQRVANLEQEVARGARTDS